MIKFSLSYFLYLTVIIITTYKNELVEIIYIININLFQRIKYFLSFSKIKKRKYYRNSQQSKTVSIVKRLI